MVGQNCEQSAQFVVGEPAFAAFLLKPFNALDRIITPPSPFYRERKHLRQQGQHTIGLIRRALHRYVQEMNVAGVNGCNLLAAKPRQDDPIDHRAVVLNASRPLLWNGMLLKVVRRKVPHCWRFTNSAIVRDRIVAFQCVGENDAGALLSLVEREQRPMLADGFPP